MRNNLIYMRHLSLPMNLCTLPALVSFPARLDLRTRQRNDAAKAARMITGAATSASMPAFSLFDGPLDKKRVCSKPLLLAVLHVEFMMTFNHSTNPWV